MTIQTLLNPASIAVVGASDKPSAGRSILRSLRTMGYAGAVYPINPRYETIQNAPCYASFEELPGQVEAAAFCVANKRLLDNFRAAIDRGLKAAVIYSGGFSESHDPEDQALSRALGGLAREAGVAVAGPNCMGVLNAATSSSLYLHEVFEPARLKGNVGFMSQSGSMCISMLSDCRRYGFSHAVSTGNEEILSSCDVLEALILDPDTRVIGCFTESVKEPERYVALLDRAADLGKPVVVLKAGKSARAKQAVISHTGGLAGDSDVFSALLRAHRAIEVDDLGAMSEILSLCQGEIWPTGPRLGVVTGSGGQTELLLDVSETTAVELPPLTPRDRAAIETVVGTAPGEGNPLDAWGNGNPDDNYPHALRVMGNSEHFDIVAFCGDGMDGHPLDAPEEDMVYAHMVAGAQPDTARPLIYMSTRAGTFRTDQVAVLRAAGVPMLSGVRTAMQAIASLAEWSRPRAAGRLVSGPPIAIDSTRPSINEFDAKALLRLTGTPVVEERLVQDSAGAAAAAREIGCPVVVKVASDDIPHKTEYGLIRLSLETPEAAAKAVSDMQARVAAMDTAPKVQGYVVQQMIPDGLEVLIGVKRDPDFGPVLVLSLGGVLVDIVGTAAIRPLPLREGDAGRMIGELPVLEKLLAGIRGAPAADRAALEACLYAVSDFLARTGDTIGEMDLNPVKVLASGQGCRVVDAVIVPARVPV